MYCACADSCASEVHPVFNTVVPYGYLLPNMYLFIADITNPHSLFNFVGPGLVSPRFCEDQRQPSSGSAWPVYPIIRPPCWGRKGSTQYAQQFMTAPPLVGCVVWSHSNHPHHQE